MAKVTKENQDAEQAAKPAQAATATGGKVFIGPSIKIALGNGTRQADQPIAEAEVKDGFIVEGSAKPLKGFDKSEVDCLLRNQHILSIIAK